MKNQIKKIAITASLALMTSMAFAQVAPANRNLPAPPAGGPGQLPPPPPGRPDAGPGRAFGLRTLTTLIGKVTAYQTNDRYAYNSFTLQTGGQSVTVRFPEHMGKQLMSAAGKGESVSVKGFTENGPDGVNAFQLVSVTAGWKQLTDTPPALPVKPVAEAAATFTGSIRDFKRDQGGAIRAITLGNNLQIELPPPAVEQLQSSLKAGDKVKVTGFKDTPPSGVVLASGAPTIVRAQTLEVNGQTYLVR